MRFQIPLCEECGACCAHDDPAWIEVTEFDRKKHPHGAAVRRPWVHEDGRRALCRPEGPARDLQHLPEPPPGLQADLPRE